MPAPEARRMHWRVRTLAIAASACLHVVLLVAIARVTVFEETPSPRAARLTDAPATTLSLAPPAPTDTAPTETPQPPDLPAPEEDAPAPAPEPPEPPVTGAAAPDEPASTPPRLFIQPAPTAGTPDLVVVDRPSPRSAPPEPALPPPTAPEVEPPPPTFTASFAGVEGVRARRIVYVIDSSAAMVPTLRFVKQELARSLARLDARQSFQIIAFRRPPGADTDDVARLTGEDGFLEASASSRDRAAAWVERVQPLGSSYPLAGLRAALELRPDLVFLLTTSIPRSENSQWGDGVEATLEALDRLNPIDPRTGERAAVIKTVQILNEDATGLLRAIAEAHGDGEGSHRVVPGARREEAP
ncbi:MAG: hypothetical protein SFY69_07455 [Planctomycetota bacterium]|nr:hypothetical protein [Planctomycetota bacterium]